MNIKNKLLLILLFFQPFTLTAFNPVEIFNSVQKSGLIDNKFFEENKANIVGLGCTLASVAVMYYIHKEWRQEKLTKEQLEERKLNNQLLKIKIVSDLYKLQKETGEEPDGLDIEKITPQFLTQSWKSIDQQTRAKLKEQNWNLSFDQNNLTEPFLSANK